VQYLQLLLFGAGFIGPHNMTNAWKSLIVYPPANLLFLWGLMLTGRLVPWKPGEIRELVRFLDNFLGTGDIPFLHRCQRLSCRSSFFYTARNLLL
jgi:hypothetical protein